MPQYSPIRAAAVPSSPDSQTMDEFVQVNLPLLPRTPHHAPVIEQVRNSDNESKEEKGVGGERTETKREQVNEVERYKEARKKRIAEVQKSGGVLLRKACSKSRKFQSKQKVQQLRVISHKPDALGLR